jgi:hypothetical protein
MAFLAALPEIMGGAAAAGEGAAAAGAAGAAEGGGLLASRSGQFMLGQAAGSGKKQTSSPSGAESVSWSYPSNT